MSALEIIKNIYVNPRRAFERDALEETFDQALLAYAVLAIVGAVVVFPWVAARSPAMQPSLARFPWMANHVRLFAMGMVAVALPFLFAEVWLLRYFAQKRGVDVAYRSLLSGRFWVGVAMIVPVWILQALATSVRWATWITFPWHFVLMAFCVQSLTGFSFKRSAWVEVLALLTMYGVIFLLTLVLSLAVFMLVLFIGHH